MKLTKVNYRSLFDLCILCLKPCNSRSGICRSCKKDLPWLNAQCSICALPLTNAPENAICGQCLKKKPSFTQVNALFLYQFPIDHFIGKIKYTSKTQYIGHLAQLLLEHCSLPSSVEALIPIPMHKVSLYKRGFNQAELLAFELGKKLKIKVDTHLLKKKKSTRRQMELKRSERLKNQRNVFQAKDNHYKHVMLIDDVMTTGATLEAAAQTLIKAGTERIDVLVIARTPK
ncbi:ComF family protein [Neptuniibacter sp. 2_MG-2023]|jgi:ComF family protein|uniref:ComF family protein n=1 Tax=Neptuniibacter sp. 2_MG-2023 TaxID=3062671 RepID=UPI0026E2C937|nr:ComF family protein [Neptuniibacter sp. 2_MG-2023]MDO6512963.1 ComF family protein [Neptuniibacter sp. 2_MG-2023]